MRIMLGASVLLATLLVATPAADFVVSSARPAVQSAQAASCIRECTVSGRDEGQCSTYCRSRDGG
ncbi:MAG TPA: hypothetical protein VFR73_19080 [Hyphomicrobiaceae bacterium]|nr:hypothetical protein [Hyphomicrobiaceae bacterium]